MNLRVRSVTGCSAMVANSMVPLVRLLDVVDVHVATHGKCIVGSLNGRRVEYVHLEFACVHDKMSLSFRLASFSLARYVLAAGRVRILDCFVPLRSQVLGN